MAALWRPLMVKFLILILTKSYFLVLRNNALTFVFFVIVIHELHGIVECVVLISLLKEGKGRGQLGFAARKASSQRLRVCLMRLKKVPIYFSYFALHKTTNIGLS